MEDEVSKFPKKQRGDTNLPNPPSEPSNAPAVWVNSSDDDDYQNYPECLWIYLIAFLQTSIVTDQIYWPN